MTKIPTKFWLMKSEPEVFSFSDLKQKKSTWWDGVRNYMARNYMIKDMRIGDLVLFYHSNANPSGIAGIAYVSAPARPDVSALNPKSPYYDAKSTKHTPRWQCVEVSYKKDLQRFIPLSEIKKNKHLKNMVLLNNSRLSVQPLTKNEFQYILELSDQGDHL